MTERQQLAHDLRRGWHDRRRSVNAKRRAEAELVYRVAQFLDDEQAALDRFVLPPLVKESEESEW